ncbi:hypothetical protein MG296_10640 [Flavobacteriaceae bacterium TK19130]|nr:hypothetical protein [Thermobacterium salinum]
MASKFSITQHFPVSSHVYKYLIRRCGSDTIEASRKSFIGSFVLSLHNRNYDIALSNSDEGLDYTFNVIIPMHKYEKVGMHITLENSQLFNNQLDKMFRDELFCHLIINKSREKKTYMKSLRSFLDVYNITEDDIKQETLYRDFKRKKAEMEKNLLNKTKGTVLETSKLVP